MSTFMNPDCEQGKHIACAGDAWDTTTDEPTSCSCSCHQSTYSLEHTEAALVALSRWIDAGNAHRDPEAVTWGRLAKVAEEAGEVIAAYIGATGQNPRKGITCTTGDVIDELLDVAVTALAAIEHLNGHDGHALRLLDNKILRVANRAGVAS